LQGLSAHDAVHQAFADSDQSVTFISGSEDDDDNDDDAWENKMDPITFARHYAAHHPLFAKVVREHDQKIGEHLNQGVSSWLDDVQSDFLSLGLVMVNR
jgi:hypothetical protein